MLRCYLCFLRVDSRDRTLLDRRIGARLRWRAFRMLCETAKIRRGMSVLSVKRAGSLSSTDLLCYLLEFAFITTSVWMSSECPLSIGYKRDSCWSARV